MKLLPSLFWSACELSFFTSGVNAKNTTEGWFGSPATDAGQEAVNAPKGEKEKEQEAEYQYSMLHAFLAGDRHKRDDSKARHDKHEYYKGREKREHKINELRIQSDRRKKSASFKVIPSFIVSVIVVIALYFANY